MKKNKQYKFSVIIVTKDSKNYIENCLNSLLQYTNLYKTEVIIVDNNSKDGTKKLIQKAFPQISLIKNQRNYGFAKSCNQGAKKARGKILVFLNPDTIIKTNFLKGLKQAFQKNKNLGIVSPRLMLPNGKLQKYSHGKNWVSGACLCIPKSIFKKVNGFDEKFFMYFEDKDLCFRVKKMGYKIKVLKKYKIIHLEGGDISKRKRKTLYYKSQNYYWKKYYGVLVSLLLRLIRFPYQLYILYFKS